MEGCCRKYGKFTTFERENARLLERNSMKYFKASDLEDIVDMRSFDQLDRIVLLRMEIIQICRVRRLGLHERSFNLFPFFAYTVTATLSIETFTVRVSLSAEVLTLVPIRHSKHC